jgi:DNA-binding beta-propeller fold protein YncE
VSTGGDPLQVVSHLVAATPAAAPQPRRPAAGTVLPAPAASSTVYDPATGTVVLASGPALSLYQAQNPQAPARRVILPAAPAGLTTAPNGTLLVAIPSENLVDRVDLRTATIQQRTPVAGAPVDAVDLGGPLGVALRDKPGVVIVNHGTVTPTNAQFQGATQLLTPAHTLMAIDRLTTSVTQLNPRTAASTDASLRAGDGVTNAVTDRYQRVLAVDTRGNALLAFSTNPLLEKQLYPVSGAPYGIAYDPTRDLAWVTLTATNEIVGYDMTGGQPVERYRFPTVRQPNSVAVDPDNGEVFIASADGAGLQVVKV